jgi:tight adherence protein B
MTTVLIAVLGFILIGGLGFAFAGPQDGSAKVIKRAQSLRSQTRSDRSKLARANDPAQRRKQILTQLKEAERVQRKASVSLTAKLQQAGLPPKPLQFWLVSAALGLVVAVVVLGFSGKPLLALGGGFVAGFGLPRWFLGFLAGGRLKKFTAAFPDAIDIIVRGIKSGLPVNDCLKIIARESPAPLGAEFQTLVENTGMGVELPRALDKMYERMPTNELRFFTIVLAIQAKTGGNLAEALNNLSTVLRARKLMREKVKALSSEAIASAAIIGSLPPAVMVLVTITTPSYMMMMFTDQRGQLMLMGGAMWMACGIFVMKKMISFKI